MITSVEFFYSGYCTHPERIVIDGGRFKSVKFPAVFAIIRHSSFGNILFDTGYSERFYQETDKFPFSLYAKLTPVYLAPGESAGKILADHGIDNSEINYIIISHFHADHIGGLKDFPRAKYIYDYSAYQRLSRQKGLKSLCSGYLAGLIPDDFVGRSMVLSTDSVVNVSKEMAPFTEGYDIFGDGSIVLVDLPGHAPGQVGALVTTGDAKRYFLVGDAVWLSKSYQQLRLPSLLANVIMDDHRQYVETIRNLWEFNQKNPDVKIIPSHCSETLKDISKWII